MQAWVYPQSMANTPLKRIRVDDALWDQFGDAVTALGLDRTKVLVAFMNRLVGAMAPPVPGASYKTGQRPKGTP